MVRSALSEIEQERRNGYAYYGTWPAAAGDGLPPLARGTGAWEIPWRACAGLVRP